MKTKRNELFLLLTALIWGFAFVAQSTGGDAVGPFTFNCIRSFLAVLVLTPVIRFLEGKGQGQRPASKQEKHLLLLAGISCGAALCIASNLQQLGLNTGAGTGKAAFLTTVYILLVPILGLFLHRRCGLFIWIGVAVALAGMYFLCFQGDLRLTLSDLCLLGSAFVYAIQILLVDHFSPLVDNIRLSRIQLLVTAIGSGLLMLFTETGLFSGGAAAWAAQLGNMGGWIAILYAGILSSGLAYTLQIVGQRGVNPAVASLLMSFESVFSAIGGWLILHQTMSGRQMLGCALIFAAVLLAQLPENFRKKADEASSG